MKTCNVTTNLLAACVLAALSTANVCAQALETPVASTGEALTIDESWALLANQYPGFSGYYYDQSGELIVQLADAQARAAGTKVADLLAVIAKSQMLTEKGKSAQTRNVKYAFDQLYRWHFSLIDLMNDTRFNVFSFDIDEVRNAIVLTVADDSSKQQLMELRKVAYNSGVPADAILIEVGSQPKPVLGLRDRVNPSPGGVEIAWVKNSAPANANQFVCSLGLNVQRGADIGFITAQHCQDANGEVFRQGGTRIGASVAIGPAVSTGCPSGATCKYSDALFAKYDTRNFAARLQIAYAPNGWNNIQGNLNVISALSTPAVGTGVWKTGRTTGSSQSTMEASCVRLKYNTHPMTFLCLNKVNTLGTVFAQGGDSGGPVWIVSGGANVSFTGLVSGTGENTIGPIVLNGWGYYSPFSSIQKDLGTLTMAY